LTLRFGLLLSCFSFGLVPFRFGLLSGALRKARRI
jgi:hypothetical protein